MAATEKRPESGQHRPHVAAAVPSQVNDPPAGTAAVQRRHRFLELGRERTGAPALWHEDVRDRASLVREQRMLGAHAAAEG
jgi:hypothetical protein